MSQAESLEVAALAGGCFWCIEAVFREVDRVENVEPTTLNRQGTDVGTQYRSSIFYHSEQQKAIAEELLAGFNTDHLWKKPIITQIIPLNTFYPAEDYHQGYFSQHPEQGYC